MSPDEVVALFVFAILVPMVWGRILAPAVRLHRLFAPPALRAQILLAPVMALALLFFFLRRYADAEVRNSALYLSFYVLFGGAWIGVMAQFFSLFGLNLRDDALERRNPAALMAWFAAVFAHTFAFAGSNIGDGPGWWVVLFCAGMAAVALFLLWLLLAALTCIRERIVLDRDPTAGRRLAGFLLAAGLILGRAAAGDWTTTTAAVADFLTAGWPALLLLAIAAGVERILNSVTRESAHGAFATGAPIGVIYIGFAAMVIRGLGPW